MIRIRVEVLATSPLQLVARTKMQGLEAEVRGSPDHVFGTVREWIIAYAMTVRRAADELVPR